MRDAVWQPVFIGIGSNLDGPREHVAKAFVELGEVSATCVVSRSPCFYSDPVGPPGQPDYVNAVVGLLTQLEPEALLDALHEVEQRHDRRRDGERWGARTLDLDILAFGNQVIRSARLTVPHPELSRRAFVLVPWRAIAPDFMVPDNGRVATLAQQVDHGTLRRINDETPRGVA
ncbi:MAG: 2-amino-4-hydroxy-6-hydroxymethyldihydropteridine diphosphokinase [Pseudomonadota bacterium]